MGKSWDADQDSLNKSVVLFFGADTQRWILKRVRQKTKFAQLNNVPNNDLFSQLLIIKRWKLSKGHVYSSYYE